MTQQPTGSKQLCEDCTSVLRHALENRDNKTCKKIDAIVLPAKSAFADELQQAIVSCSTWISPAAFIPNT
jgi:hypothetical protein